MSIEQEPIGTGQGSKESIAVKKEALLKRINSPEFITEQIEFARHVLRDSYGLELTNVELFGLRRITETVVKDLNEQERNSDMGGGHSHFTPGEEITARFILEFYDINPTEDAHLFAEYSEDEIKEYFRRKQASLHMP